MFSKHNAMLTHFTSRNLEELITGENRYDSWNNKDVPQAVKKRLWSRLTRFEELTQLIQRGEVAWDVSHDEVAAISKLEMTLNTYYDKFYFDFLEKGKRKGYISAGNFGADKLKVEDVLKSLDNQYDVLKKTLAEQKERIIAELEQRELISKYADSLKNARARYGAYATEIPASEIAYAANGIADSIVRSIDRQTAAAHSQGTSVYQLRRGFDRGRKTFERLFEIAERAGNAPPAISFPLLAELEQLVKDADNSFGAYFTALDWDKAPQTNSTIYERALLKNHHEAVVNALTAKRKKMLAQIEEMKMKTPEAYEAAMLLLEQRLLKAGKETRDEIPYVHSIYSLPSMPYGLHSRHAARKIAATILSLIEAQRQEAKKTGTNMYDERGRYYPKIRHWSKVYGLIEGIKDRQTKLSDVNDLQEVSNGMIGNARLRIQEAKLKHDITRQTKLVVGMRGNHGMNVSKSHKGIGEVVFDACKTGLYLLAAHLFKGQKIIRTGQPRYVPSVAFAYTRY